MAFERVELQLPNAMLDAAQTLAASQDITLGQLVRDAVQRELERSKPKTRICADEALVARLQRLLACDIAAAKSWDHLATVLHRKGFSLRPAGGGLTLHDASGGRLCKSSEIGFGYARLVKRFRAPMPGHPHRMAHLFAQTDDDFDVIEPF